jgi:hypothetical protein
MTDYGRCFVGLYQFDDDRCGAVDSAFSEVVTVITGISAPI